MGSPQRQLREATARRRARGWYHWEDPAYLFLMQSLERHILALLSELGLPSLGGRLLEVGCGTGHWLREAFKWSAGRCIPTGLDLLPERLRQAPLVCGSASQLPFASGSFDVVLQAMAFSSIPDGSTRTVAAQEILRVLSIGGSLIWYDFFIARPGNRDVRPMSKSEIARLFPSCEIKLCRVTLAPPITRAFARHSWLACDLLERLPFLRTHYLGLIRPR
jgi:SAM-dependent methyltransferase